MVHEVILPQLGETMDEGTIVRWLVREGDTVRKGDALFQFESDKAVLDVEATASGQVLKVLQPQGAKVKVLSVVALVGEPGDDVSAYLAPAPATAQPAPAAPQPAVAAQVPVAAVVHEGRLFATPRARRAAREKGIDLTQVRGSGPDGRIVEADVLAHLEASPRVTPLARKVAAEASVDLAGVVGSGPGGRVVRADLDDTRRGAVSAPAVSAPAVSTPAVSAPTVSAPAVSAPAVSTPAVSPPAAAAPAVSTPAVSAPTVSAPAVSAPAVSAPAVSAPAAAAPAVSAPTPAAGELVPMAGVRARIAERMGASARETARVTLTSEVDATRLVELRTQLKTAYAEALGFAIGYNDLLIAICARALREHPQVNSRLEGDSIRRLAEVHIGLAVDTERGLLVPVVRHADRLGVVEIARAVRELVARAREGKSGPDELKGGTFTITNLGAFDVDAFTPIINLPECAILGVGRIAPRPAVVAGQLAVRERLWLSLTFDHRLVDGAPAARFLQRMAQLVEEPYLLLA